MTKSERERLREGAAELGAPLDDRKLDQFARYGEMLADWNTRINLTRVPRDEFVTLHYLDSLALFAALPPPFGARVIDVGTGAGLPGIPLVIARPDLEMTLLDSTRKRLAFVDAVIAELGVSGATTVHARAEQAAKERERRVHYDLSVARAVARLSELAGWMLPFIRPGGAAVAMKSAGVERELADALPAIRAAGASLERDVRVTLPGTQICRRLVIMRKAANRGTR